MDTMVRDVKLALELTPVYWQEPVDICIKFNGAELFAVAPDQTIKFDWLLPATDQNRLSIFVANKTDADSQDGKDRAIVVDSIGIEGFYYKSFMHASRYCPEYPDGYYNYAKENNITVEPVIHSNYLGFNGEWFLDFTWPTFTWIYNLETSEMGWIYEKNI